MKDNAKVMENERATLCEELDRCIHDKMELDRRREMYAYKVQVLKKRIEELDSVMQKTAVKPKGKKK